MASQISDIQGDTSAKRIFIVGGGIVGAALAFYLSEYHVEEQIVVLDKSLSTLSGSTGYAPGFVGQFNTSTVLTNLAKDTVKEYLSVPGGFDTVGGLELALTPDGAENLQERFGLAKEAGIPAEIISPEKAAKLAPDFVKTESVVSALYFPSDGTANADIITRFFRQKAEARGAVFLEASIAELEVGSGTITTILTSKGAFRIGSNPVILCTGIWTRTLLHNSSITESPVPIVPIAHPYTFTPSRPPRAGSAYPFVRWPQHHVYARDHGDHDGLGSYNHMPSQVDTSLQNSAVGNWPADFEAVLDEACRTCPKNGDQFVTKRGSKDENATGERKPFNGIFSVTPDNLPLAGKVEGVQNLWLCAAVWITHAAGTAKLIARQFIQKHDDAKEVQDDVLLKALDPNRFKGGDPEALTREAIGKYNDIYNRQKI
jgi:glycine/D-amino acid oxidase-like deaminating enzyme